MHRRLPVSLALIPAGLALAIVGCGPTIPAHNGYKKKQQKPWLKAQPVTFDEAGKADIDSKVSWAKRRRARWYAMDIPRYGDVEVRLRSEQYGEATDEFDLAFEIVNERGKVLVHADKESDDSGEEEKTRKLAELDPGKYWIHVFLQNRIDAATFNLRVTFVPTTAPDESNFPKDVVYVGNLAAVPPVDDAPPPVAKRPRCRGKKCKKPKKPKAASSSAIKARLIGVRARDNGRTSITIGIGTNRGITKGSRGNVVTASGGKIQGGSFTVTKVTGTKSFASVKASLDAVNAAKFARITPKKTAPVSP